jgi:hypothetical protein
MQKTVGIGKLFFDVATTRIDAETWQASVERLTEGDGEHVRNLVALGPNQEAAVEGMVKKLKETMTITASSLSAGELTSLGVNWVWRAPSRGVRAFRALAVAAVATILSPFFIDFAGGTSPISVNTRHLLNAMSSETVKIPPSHFLDEEFIGAALRNAHKELWASGVSFRNMVAGNRAALDSALRRGVRVRIVLLDPNSPLAQDGFIDQLSRTAKRSHIESTIQLLVGPGGILTVSGQRGVDELWVSEYAPIVPMVRVDDRILAGFLLHVDAKRQSNAYGASYIDIATDSKMGQDLLAHFNAMLADPSARRIDY